MTQVNVQMVEQLNKRSQVLNTDRQRMLGQREAAQIAYDKAVYAYEQKYGVRLDGTNLQQEYNTVSAQLAVDYERLSNLVRSIESGEYKNPQPPLPTPSPEPVPVPEPTPQPVPPKVDFSVSTPPVASYQQAFGQPQQAGSPVVQSTPAVQSVPEQVSQPAQVMQEGVNKQVNPSMFADLLSASQNQVPNIPHSPDVPSEDNSGFGVSNKPAVFGDVSQNGNTSSVPQNSGDQEDVSEQAFTPQGWGKPNKDIEAKFGGLGFGASGKKFGQ